jgi:hypothetical protein
MEEKHHPSAHHLFDGRSERQEVTTIYVLHVTVRCVMYPVTEKVLHLVFDPYGMNGIYVIRKTTHVEAFVEFRSWSEAARARGALHG